MLDTEKIQSVLTKADALAANTTEGFALAITAAFIAGMEAARQATMPAA